jgi:AcrR family transcriptional regulator
VPGAWMREDQADLAVAKILDGAGQAFVDLGVSGAGMGEIARYSGCSRGTLYRYFPNRHALHLAFVNDRAVRLVTELNVELEAIADPSERLTRYILCAVRKVRGNPSMVAWFAPTESGFTARMSRGSEVIGFLADAFVSNLQGGRTEPGSRGFAARWMVRVILSLLTMPGESEEEERILIESFVAPSLLAGAAPGFPNPRK